MSPVKPRRLGTTTSPHVLALSHSLHDLLRQREIGGAEYRVCTLLPRYCPVHDGILGADAPWDEVANVGKPLELSSSSKARPIRVRVGTMVATRPKSSASITSSSWWRLIQRTNFLKPVVLHTAALTGMTMC